MLPGNKTITVAYFSMEIGLESHVPTYSGGLGILAGDTLRAAADLRVPMLAVTLLHRKGYFHQKLDSEGNQAEEAVDWPVDDYLQPLPQTASIVLEGRTIRVACWQYNIETTNGFVVPVYLLDTSVPENTPEDRQITDYLYGGDLAHRLRQEAVLGIGGLRLLRALGYDNIQRFHLNEGHASLLTLALLEEHLETTGHEEVTQDDIEAVRRQCVFTTHTPVEAGQDRFPHEMVRKILGERKAFKRMDIFCCNDEMNLTYLALNLSHYVNGVARKHAEVSKLKFAHYSIESITNGVHAGTWVSPPFQKLYDRYIPNWQEDNCSLRYAFSIPFDQIWLAHRQCKKQLLQFANQECNAGMDFDIFTIGFARRFTQYKRPDLIFYDLERLKKINKINGPIQIIFAGKAHPRDVEGKGLIKKIFRAKYELRPEIKIAYLPNYDMNLARTITSGVDLWLNTPQQPMEASGTSGMKAALNGVPSLSIMDGWWIEGCIEGLTGWAIGKDSRALPASAEEQSDVEMMYDKLENTILPLYKNNRDQYLNIMMHCIALNGSFFNTHRMLQQYVLNAYFR
jgi:starch phosphorylase